MKRDYYKILDVSRNADELTIKSAYRKLAVQYHPDRNPGSRVAEEKFKEATEAYQVLIDPIQRYTYDAQNIRPPGVPRFRWPSVRVIPFLTAVVTAFLALVSVFILGKVLATNVSRNRPAYPLSRPDPPSVAESRPVQQSVAKKRPVGPVGIIDIVHGARPITQTPLNYSPEALRERVSGLVELQFTIAEDGSIQKPMVLSGHPLLAQGVSEAISRWTFQPMRVNGRPSPMTTEMTIRFSIVR